jgi:O-antigen/teichoic acid export membrane protein
MRLARGGRFERARLFRYAAYGVPLSISLGLNVLLASVDRFVIAAFLDEASVGAYHAGYTLSNRTLDVLFLWLAMAGQPACVAALERGGQAALDATARSQVSLMLLIGAPAAAGVALVASPLAHLMIGEGLADTAARVTPWIAAAAFLSGITNQYLNTAFTLARQTRRLMAVIAVPAVANLILTLVLIPRFGLDGAMWAVVASYGVGAVASIVMARGCCALPLPLDVVARVAAATGIMAVAVAAAPAIGGVAELALKASIGVAVYAAAALALNAAGVRAQLPMVMGALTARVSRA